MTLNQIGELILKQAEDKGWGHTKDTLVVSEKMMLISTEITEMHEALHKKAKNEKDTLAAEFADILMRTLHLGLAWEIDFDEKIEYKSRFAGRSETSVVRDSDYLYLYALVSKGYDSYRHRKIKTFKKYLYRIAHEVYKITKYLNVDIEKAAVDKILINKSRTWSSKKLYGNYFKS